MDRNKNKTKTFNNVENSAKVNDIVNQFQSKSDPNGSYTGVPLNSSEKPVQDADDL